MAGIRRVCISVCAVCLLALSALIMAYSVRTGPGIRAHPWLLEARLDSFVASCSAEPEIFGFDGECESLAAQAAEIRQCLNRIDRRWAPLRNYSGCMPALLSAIARAQFLELQQAEQRQREEHKLAALMESLDLEINSGSEGRKVWSSFDTRNINRNRANNLVREARILASQGDLESALRLTLLASAEFQKFSDRSGRVLARFEDTRLSRIWNQQASDLLQWSRKNGRRALLVDKLEHRCVVFNKGRAEKSYPVNLGRNWYQQKIKEHDSSTPEGEFKVRKMIPSGKYGFALLLDYPTAADHARFRDLKKAGAIALDSRIGGNVEIHGGGRSSSDWTEGCVSLRDEDMRDLYRRTYVGMPVTIVGTCRLVASLKDR